MPQAGKSLVSGVIKDVQLSVRVSSATLRQKQLSGIHDVLRIDNLLDRPHKIHRACSQLGVKVLLNREFGQ